MLLTIINEEMQLTNDHVGSKQLGHLGLLAGVIRELGIIEKLDKRLELSTDKGGIVSHGQRVAAMILNGLGFMNSRLYMTTHYFQDKPVAQLLGSDIDPCHLNDDCLGRCLDKIAQYGVTKLYSEIAFEIAKEKNLLTPRLHLDSTSFYLEGRYDVDAVVGTPQPTYGYSKDHRPDLKQVMLSLIQGGEANLPLWMEAQDGNTSDKKSFQETVRRVKVFIDKLHDAPDNLCFVVDAEFYVPEKLAELDNVKWITRVPATLNEAKLYINSPTRFFTWHRLDDNYQVTSKEIVIANVQQRWVMVKSEHAYKRELATFERRLQKQFETINNDLWHLSNQTFACPDDAEKALQLVLKRVKNYQVHTSIVATQKHQKRGRPIKAASKEIVGYRVDYSIASDIEMIRHSKECLGRFILATNQLDMEKLNEGNVLRQYKEQSRVESGFKFIKDSAFELDSFYLKTPARIGALMMVMTLCLMVYNFAQYHLRKCLSEHDDALPNQLGKPIKNPTMKWIAELMCAIAVVTINTGKLKQRFVTNVNEIHKRIITYFGKGALIIYGLPPDLRLQSVDYSNYKKLRDWCEM